MHIGGFLFGLFASLALLPRTNYRCRSLAVNSCVKAIFVTLLLILLVCMCVAFFLVRNPKKFCSWCHYVDCVPYKKDHFCPSMDSDGFLDNGTWRQVTIMFRVVANSTPVGIRLRAVSLTPWFNERNAWASSGEPARCEKKGPPRVFNQLRGHFRVSRVSLDGLTKKRDCWKSNDACAYVKKM